MISLKKEEKIINNELLRQKTFINKFNLQIKEVNKEIKKILNYEKFKNNENLKLKGFILDLHNKINKGELIMIKDNNNHEEKKEKNENEEEEKNDNEEEEKKDNEEEEKNDNESNI